MNKFGAVEGTGACGAATATGVTASAAVSAKRTTPLEKRFRDNNDDDDEADSNIALKNRRRNGRTTPNGHFVSAIGAAPISRNDAASTLRNGAALISRNDAGPGVVMRNVAGMALMLENNNSLDFKTPKVRLNRDPVHAITHYVMFC